jgi:serine/threonine-protein kinase
MATISLAEDTVLGRLVALKRLTGTASQSGVSRLRREALVGASVSHPNLVSIYDVVADDEDVVIVMEYVDGRTLKEALARDGRLAPDEALPILRGVASALDTIHARGIVHRDVKPPNILLGRGGEVKLADLGIAAAPDHTSITVEGSVLGSFSYMAPEQLEAAPASPAMDVYALAAVAFEALSGQRARREDNPLALAHAIATQPPPDLGVLWPEAPAAVTELLKRGMSRVPNQRPGSAGELVEDLQAAFGPGLGASGPGLGASGPGLGAPRAVAAVSPAPATPATPATPAAPAAEDPGERPTRISTRIAEPRKRPPSPPAPPIDGSRRRPAWLAPLLLGLVAAAILAIVLGSGGGAHRSAATGSTHRPAAGKAKGKTTASPATTRATPASSGPGQNKTPISAVERFYELAASHRFHSAWALADPFFRSQLRGYDSFVSGQEGDRRIIFDSARVVNQTASSATVAISTTSVRDDGTEQCAGTVALVPGGGGWLLHQIDINCRPAYATNPRPGPGKPPPPAGGKPPKPGHGKHS